MAKTKIVCTLGPASDTETVLRKMILAGMDVARLNFSHGTHEDHLRRIKIIRKINKKYRRHIRILLDLEGPRIRVGLFKNHQPIELKKRMKIWITQEKCLGNSSQIHFDYHGPLKDIKKGHFIYIDDGQIALRVISVFAHKLQAEVIVGGLLKERKGVNIPDAKLHFGPLSSKDRSDIHFGIEHKVDFIAQSFVRSREDVEDVASIFKWHHAPCKIISKIENREGIRNIKEIIKASDGIMVARGDMGISIPVYEVPIMQKEIIAKCNNQKKPVITATQMLESMTEHRLPTRAEVTDVANAILDGTNFVMLSAESAAGKYPVETVQMMNNIIKYTESSKIYKKCRLVKC